VPGRKLSDKKTCIARLENDERCGSPTKEGSNYCVKHWRLLGIIDPNDQPRSKWPVARRFFVARKKAAPKKKR
jgi:hypothetical protein